MVIRKIDLTPAACAVDLGDGSERGLYVPQSYILNKLGRPHRAVNLMYCYYPFDKEWPARIGDVYPEGKTGAAWSLPYDDYFPLTGEEPFERIKDIRRHGQDVLFTLTCDPAVTDEMIRNIARGFRDCGRFMLRLNHEATGSWFSFNRRASYQEIADFFVRFTKIVHEEAPNVKMMLCIGGIEDLKSEEIVMEDIFKEAVQVTDIWSVDKYPSLNYGWPKEVAEKDNFGHYCRRIDDTLAQERASFDRYSYLCGGEKRPMELGEHNEDGDVVGPIRQAERMKIFYDDVEKTNDGKITGISMYQFRDDGRLGLEVTDPNDPSMGIEQPLLKTYREIIHRDFFKPAIKDGDEVQLPVTLRWGDAEDAEGVALEIPFEGNPVFCEANFGEKLKPMNLMMELNGRWFRKAAGVTFVDFLPAFWERPLKGAETLQLRLFAPPTDGKNVPNGRDDWDINWFTELEALPDLRIRYESIADSWEK